MASHVYLILQTRLRTVAIAYLPLAVLGVTCLTLLIKAYPLLSRGSMVMSIQAPFLRLAVMVNLSVPLARHASFTGLAQTMQRVHLPGVIRLPLLAAIRFIPTFFNDFKQLREAVKLRFRGRSGLCFWLRRPRLWARVMFMPLVIRLIRSTDELGVAAELKGLNVTADFGRRPLRLGRADLLTMIFGLACIVGVFCRQVFNVAN